MHLDVCLAPPSTLHSRQQRFYRYLHRLAAIGAWGAAPLNQPRFQQSLAVAHPLTETATLAKTSAPIARRPHVLFRASRVRMHACDQPTPTARATIHQRPIACALLLSPKCCRANEFPTTQQCGQSTRASTTHRRAQGRATRAPCIAPTRFLPSPQASMLKCRPSRFVHI